MHCNEKLYQKVLKSLSQTRSKLIRFNIFYQSSSVPVSVKSNFFVDIQNNWKKKINIRQISSIKHKWLRIIAILQELLDRFVACGQEFGKSLAWHDSTPSKVALARNRNRTL